jgi:methyl-accepting chemotaxis protein
VGFLSKFSIKMKVTAGFVLMQLIIAAVALSAFFNFKSIQQDVGSVAEDYLPGMAATGELQFTLERGNSALGFYLLSKEKVHKQHYLKSLEKADKIIAKLQDNTLVKTSKRMTQLVKGIVSDVEAFKAHQSYLLELATNPAKNYPAIQAAIEHVNPISKQMLQMASGMIQAETDEEAIAERRPLLLALDELRYARANVMNTIRGYLANRTDQALEQIRTYSEVGDMTIERVKKHADMFTLGQEDTFDQFAALNVQFTQGIEKVISIHSSEKWRMDSYMIRTKIGPIMESIDEKVQTLVSQLRLESKSITQNLVEQANNTTALIVVLLIVGLLVGFLIAWIITSVIVTPLNHALHAMADIAGGDGDLTRRLDDSGNDEISQLAHGFNLFACIVQNMVRQIGSYTGRLSNEAERLTIVTKETSTGADMQQNEIDQVVTAMTELAQTGLEVARNASMAAEAAGKADDAAIKGRLVVGHTIESIDGLASEVEKAADVINQLEKESESIGGVLDVIKGIAEQTNLLALNAAIEAARAGEQGRGFAVVADEVRTLASRTQQSTSEIQTKIERLQSGSRNAVQVMNFSREKAEATVGQAAKAGTSLEEITDSVRIINERNTEIASAAEEQNAVASNINKTIISISAITDQTAAGAQQTSSASNELNELAEQLTASVSQFKI